MKQIFLIVLMLAGFTLSAQTFNYTTYCSGMQIDTCRRVVQHSTCKAIRGVITLSKEEIKIDSATYFVFSSDSSNNRVYYYVDDISKDNGVSCIIFDPIKVVFTILSGDYLHTDIMHMDFYLSKNVFTSSDYDKNK